jgi:hypothetical protein
MLLVVADIGKGSVRVVTMFSCCIGVQCLTRSVVVLVQGMYDKMDQLQPLIEAQGKAIRMAV